MKIQLQIIIGIKTNGKINLSNNVNIQQAISTLAKTSKQQHEVFQLLCIFHKDLCSSKCYKTYNNLPSKRIKIVRREC